MPISECCIRDVICCNAEATLQEAAALMRKHHVGDLIVIDKDPAQRIPLGILTDRDIVIETVATGLDVATFTAGDVMSAPVVTVPEDAGFVEALRVMRNRGVRRLPVTNSEGTLVGLVSADDILQLLAEEMSMLARTAAQQRDHEKTARR
ncbi:CBS domain-containing protein [Lacisediminimonas sp.]|uniref:CBS domain-containing protein n=1 Tax=Lacisediminimonas sp. TaxID=3060582 RepID=UPI002726A593|nr:CBS domain-containing protein [Lacisediminimonas sp.]MDO8300462.1 CBS domain-containing protein [Lacisediminimonas sp.]